jgi:4-amino-4-deoxy-L-arabinose transferase-like glycosyltransferase
MPGKLFFVIAYLLLIAGLFINLGDTPLKFEEPRRALVSLEMILSDNYILPTVNGEPYLKKPPVFNWVLVGMYSLFSSNSEWVTRLPTVLSFILIIIVLVMAGRRYVNLEFGLLSGLLFAVSSRLLFYGVNFAEIDMFFTFILVTSVMGFYVFYRQEKRYAAFVWAYFFCAIGILTKSFPALVFTGFSISVYLLIRRDYKTLFSLAHVTGIVIMLILISGYLILLSQHIPLDQYFSSILKDSSQRTVVNNSAVDFFLHLVRFPVEFILSLFPGSLLLIYVFRSKSVRETIIKNDYILFSCIALGATFWIYWFSPGARLRYVFMLFPFFLNVVLYFYWIRQSEGKNQLLNVLLNISCGLAALALIIAPFVYPLGKIHMFILILLGFGIGAIPFFQKYFQVYGLYGFILLFLLLRIGFDLVILPIRAEGDTSMDKEDAIAIAGSLAKPLYVTHADKLNNRPVFYLTKYKNEIIREQKEGSGFYLIRKDSILSSDIIEYEFRNQDYVVVFR